MELFLNLKTPSAKIKIENAKISEKASFRKLQKEREKSKGNVFEKSLMHKKIENSIEKKLIRHFIMQ